MLKWGGIIVALVDNQVTLKRLQFDKKKQTYYLHPENDGYDDIYDNELAIQGVAKKVITVKDIV